MMHHSVISAAKGKETVLYADVHPRTNDSMLFFQQTSLRQASFDVCHVSLMRLRATRKQNMPLKSTK